MKFTDKLLKKSLIHDIELYPNFFSNIFKIPNKNKLIIFILWDKIIPEYIFNEIKRILSDYEITFMNSEQISKYLLKYDPWMIGYNSFHFDDVLMKALINNYNKEDLLSFLYKIADWSINENGTNYHYSKYKYNSSIKGIDLMRVSGLDRIFKPLKQTAANLRHEKIQDLPIKPGTIIKEKDIIDIIIYELNDVIITEKLLLGIPLTHNSPTVPKTAHNGLLESIDFRKEIGDHFKIDILNSNKSQIGEKMAADLYSKASGRDYYEFKQLQTNREIIYYSDVIFKNVKFKTPPLQKFLVNLKKVKYNISKSEKLTKKDREIFLIKSGIFIHLKLFGLDIHFKQGGIHFIPEKERILIPENNQELLEADASSYYPMLYKNYKIEPKHLPGFSLFVDEALELRLEYKKKGMKVFANGIKIPLNRCYGGFGDNHGWLKDILALLRTTINGQLFLLMLTEECYLNGIIPTVGNTDGIFFFVDNTKRIIFDNILSQWEKDTRMIIDPEKYNAFFLKDVNNYISVTPEKLKLRGVYDYFSYLEKYGEFDLTGSFNKPIIAYSVVQYFTKKIPIKESILKHIKNYPEDGIYDFCIAKKVAKQFNNELYTIKGSKIEVKRLQQSVRYYISKSNQKLFKVKLKTDRELLNLLKKSQKKYNTTDNSYILLEHLNDSYLYLGYINTDRLKGYLHSVKHFEFFPNPKKEWLHYDEFEAGKNVTLFNDYFKSNNYNIDYDYYIKEAQKLIDSIEKKEIKKKIDTSQLKLF